MPSFPGEVPPLSERIAWAVTPSLIRGLGRIAWRLRVEVEGDLPDPPFVVAGNHHSFLDPFLVGGVLARKLRFLALDELFGNYSLVDRVLDVYDVIPVKRGAVPLGPIRTALGHLSDGGVVGLFPEGTRHWDFDPGRVRPGAAWLAIRAQVPLVPVALVGTDRVLGVDNKLRAGRVRVTVGPALRGTGANRDAVDDLTRRWGVWIASRL